MSVRYPKEREKKIKKLIHFRKQRTSYRQAKRIIIIIKQYKTI